MAILTASFQLATGQYMGNVGEDGETETLTLEEALELQRQRIESAESNLEEMDPEPIAEHQSKQNSVSEEKPDPQKNPGTKLTEGQWVKYDLSFNTNTNSRMYSVPSFGFSLSGGVYPFGAYSNSGLSDTKFLKIELEDVRGSKVTLVTKAVKYDGSEEYLGKSSFNYGENFFVINPNIKIGESVKFIFPGQTEQPVATMGLEDITLRVQEFTSILVGDKDLKAIKSTFSKTISFQGGVGEVSLITYHEKNTGMLLLFEANIGGRSGGQYMNMDILLNAVEVSDSFLKPKSSFGGGCLIATATYGSELAPQVQQLRELRDNKLLQTESGTSFMTSFNDVYYSFSPAIADLERQNPAFKEAVKITITPLVASLSLLNNVDLDSEESVLGYGISLILLNVGMYFVAPALLVIGIYRKHSFFV